MTDISNTDDIIGSRDVIARIEELTDELETARADQGGETESFEEWLAAVLRDSAEPFHDEARELASLKTLAEEASGYAADWQHGETLIRDSYFKDYAQQLADDIGAIDRNASWPCNCIDWDQAARELRMDYTAVDFDGVTYWIR